MIPLLETILDTTVRAGTPILFGTLGAILCERSGVINLGIEGLMLIGALAGFSVTLLTGSFVVGLLAAIFFAMLAGMLHALITVHLKGNQIVSGLALAMLGLGVSALFGRNFVGKSLDGIHRIEIPLLEKLPLLGVLFRQDILVYLSVFLVIAITWFFSSTRWGLYLRTVGENPGAADTSGIPVTRYRFWAVAIGGGICGIGGAYMSTAYTPFWVENMTAGRGWIAVSLVIFAMWSAPRALFGAYLFGGINAAQLQLQAHGTTVSPYLLSMLPYLFTIGVLIWSTRRLEKGASNEPASLGVPYDREDRK